MKRILLVDHNKDIRNLLSRELSWIDRRSAGLLHTPYVEKAIRYVQSNGADLAILHQKTIDKSTVRMISTIYNHCRDLPFILSTESPSDKNAGFLTILKQSFWVPHNPEGMGIMPELVETILDVKASGFMTNMPLEAFLQMISMENRSCRIKIKSKKGDTGVMLIADGEIYQAFANRLSGKEAAVEMISWTGTDIVLFDGCKLLEKKVESSVNFLIMEGCRRRDEKSDTSSESFAHAKAANSAAEISLLASDEIPLRGENAENVGKKISRPDLFQLIETMNCGTKKRSQSNKQKQAFSSRLVKDAKPVVCTLASFVSRLEGVKALLIVLNDGTVLSKKQPASSSEMETALEEILADIQFQSASTKYMRLRSHVIPSGKKSDLMVFSLSPLNVVIEVDAGANINSYVETMKPLIKRAAFRLRTEAQDHIERQ